MRRTGRIITTICILTFVGTARAAELYVPDDYNTIQAAIDAAIDGDTVIVADGTYTGEGNRDIFDLGKAITVQSENGPENCIIDCNGTESDNHRAFNIRYRITDGEFVLDGFTITNAYGLDDSFQGAIYCYRRSPTIANCIIVGNQSGSGGGIACHNGNPTIINCVISDNAARYYGGGIYCEGGNEKIINCTISGNTADVGGGLACSSNTTINNCTIAGNTTSYKGGAIYCEQSNLAATHCNISGNLTYSSGGGIYCRGTTMEIIDCNISGNWSEGGGGGIYCFRETTAEIIDCNISGNCAGEGGGGICGGDSNSVISSCLFSENISAEGGAIYNWRGLISDSTIIGNSVSRSGGGIHCHNLHNFTITNCTIASNSAQEDGGGINGKDGYGIINNCIITANSAGESGGGIYRWRGTVKNSIITANSAHSGGGIGYTLFVNACAIVGNRALHSEGGLGRLYRDSSVTNCIIWDNYAPRVPQLFGAENLFYNCIQDWDAGGQGNIIDDPCFVVPGYWADANDSNIIVEPNDPSAVWVEGDYHLLIDSPCIDAGDPNYVAEPNETDLDGKSRVIGERIDMGAYEFWPPIEGQMKLTPQTLNCASKGRFIKAHITLPEEIFPEDIDVNTPAVADPPDVESEYIKVFASGKGTFTVEIAFDRGAFCEALTETGQIEVTVSGCLTTGREFYASDTIKIRAQGPHRRRLRTH